LIDSGTWGDTKKFSEKLRLMEECIKERTLLEVIYQDRKGMRTERVIEPHLLVFKQGVWYVYAFCHQAREFQLFRLGRIFTLIQTKTTFRKRTFEWSDIPCLSQKEKHLSVQLAIHENAVGGLQDKLGVETTRKINGKRIAEVVLPDDERTVNLLLGLGKDVEVLSPLSLREKMGAASKEIAKKYE
jgi:predicted DNA-binding transcriptional regulator YafY